MKKPIRIIVVASVLVAGYLASPRKQGSHAAVFEAPTAAPGAKSGTGRHPDPIFTAAKDAPAIPRSPATENVSGISGDALLPETNSLDSSEAIARQVAEVPAANFRDAMELALRDNASAEYRELLQRRWAETDPKAAGAWAGGLADSTNALPLIRQTAIVWANKDMNAAVAWAGSLPESQTRDAAIIALGYEAARTLSFDAFDLVAGLQPSIDRDNLLEHIVRNWTADDPNAALNWVSQLPQSPLRQQLLGAVAITASSQDPATAASVTSIMEPGPNQNRAAVSVVKRWSRVDREGAANWVEQFQATDIKAAAEGALANPTAQ